MGASFVSGKSEIMLGLVTHDLIRAWPLLSSFIFSRQQVCSRQVTWKLAHLHVSPIKRSNNYATFVSRCSAALIYDGQQLLSSCRFGHYFTGGFLYHWPESLFMNEKRMVTAQ